MKLTIEFDLNDPDAKHRFERMYHAETAWAAIEESYNKVRLALKHIDQEDAFRDAMVETRAILMNAMDQINE